MFITVETNKFNLMYCIFKLQLTLISLA